MREPAGVERAFVKKTRQNKDWRGVMRSPAAFRLTGLKWTMAGNIGKTGISAPFPRDQD